MSTYKSKGRKGGKVKAWRLGATVASMAAVPGRVSRESLQVLAGPLRADPAVLREVYAEHQARQQTATGSQDGNG